VRDWLQADLGGRRFTTVDVAASLASLDVQPLGWSFSYRR
jgi:hypothetical protein